MATPLIESLSWVKHPTVSVSVNESLIAAPYRLDETILSGVMALIVTPNDRRRQSAAFLVFNDR
jgi:hypothetical protein